MSYLLPSILEGGPADGAEFGIPESLEYLLVALGPELHGYEFTAASTPDGRWRWRYQRLLARSATGEPIAPVLREAGRPVVEMHVTHLSPANLLPPDDTP